MKKNAKLRFAIAGFTAAMLFLASGCERENHQHYTDTEHSGAVTADSELLAWEDNEDGHLELEDNANQSAPAHARNANTGAGNWASVSAGYVNTIAITTNGELWAWGANWDGGLGLGDTVHRNTPRRVGDASNWASSSSNLAAGDRDWASSHTLAITTTGELWAWGLNLHGQLGLGDTASRNAPTRVDSASNWASVSVGFAHTVAITTSGELWAWGRNQVGQLGLADTANRDTPERVGSASNWASVSAGSSYTLAVTTNGELWAWGDNWRGQLGLGDTVHRNTPTRVGNASNWASVSADDDHTMAITTTGELWAWGGNASGQLGLGDTVHRNTPTRVGSASNWASVSAGSSYTLAVTTNGELWAWGSNWEGRLGLGDTANRNAPTRVGSASNWASVSAGWNHTVAITTSGELWVWGNNEFGQLGLGDTASRNTPTRVGGASNWAGSGDRMELESGVARVWIPAGTFTMGSPEDEADNRREHEGPQRQVTISQGFWMGVYQITQEQWTRVMGSNPSHFQDNPVAGETQGRRPVERVNWYDALVFANRLSIMDGLSPAYRLFGSTNPDDWGPVPTPENNAFWDVVEIVPGSNGWRLPTEAQWEYAARAGTTTAFSNGNNAAAFGNIAWFGGNSGGMTREVGLKQPNSWGLHDIHGNVWEWVWDWFGTYPAQAQTDPAGASSGSFRVLRGGGWYNWEQSARSAFRNFANPLFRYHNLGVRLVRP